MKSYDLGRIHEGIEAQMLRQAINRMVESATAMFVQDFVCKRTTRWRRDRFGDVYLIVDEHWGSADERGQGRHQ